MVQRRQGDIIQSWLRNAGILIIEQAATAVHFNKGQNQNFAAGYSKVVVLYRHKSSIKPLWNKHRKTRVVSKTWYIDIKIQLTKTMNI